MNIFSSGKMEKEVKVMIQNHFNLVSDCLENTIKMLVAIKEKKGNPTDSTFIIHKKEKEADIIRREILKKIETGAFMPSMRSELLNLIERVDSVANKCECVGDYYSLFRPDFSDNELSQLIEIAEMSKEAFRVLHEAYNDLFDDFSLVIPLCQKIEYLEEKIDRIEWKLQTEVFKDKDIAMNILKKDFIMSLCNISDRIEDASDMLEVMVVRRKI
jgi:predicted phosphate transport protein (TIGR00153 family)